MASELPLMPVEERSCFTPAHFSDLKWFARSPAHFKEACSPRREPTRDMRVGTIGHHIVLGPHRTRPLIKYGGDARKGKEWATFLAEHEGRGEIVTQAEWDDGDIMAQAVLADPQAAKLLAGCRREVALSWTDAGVECATDGIDFVEGSTGLYIGDLKFTNSSEPAQFSRHAIRQWWHAQMVWQQRGARANNIQADDLYLIGCESTPPYVVTVLHLAGEELELGARSLGRWLERLVLCREAKFFPGYTQTIAPFVVPRWLSEVDDDE